jgi:phosphoglycerate dehydrogenase-like enzyme
MKPNILVICTLKDKLVRKYSNSLLYLPMSNEETETTWENLIKQHQPNTIIFGLQTIDEKKLSTWRQLQPDASLAFIRKGTSLHRVDFAAAKKYQVAILNTAGVNSPFVADFIVRMLLASDKPELTTAVLGVGDIGEKVVAKLSNVRAQVFLFRSQSSPADLLDIFSRSNQVAVCLPLNDGTNGLICDQHIRALPLNAEIICVSPPRVMSADAIIALEERKDIHVRFDHVESGLAFIYASLGHTDLRQHFIFEEKAAASDECQYAMGEAAIIKALNR